MPNFEIKRISPPESVHIYHKLIKDGHCLYDEFRDSIHEGGNLVSDLNRLIRFIKWDEQGKKLPEGVIKVLKGRDKNDHIVDFEFRTEKLRLYFFREDNVGNIIVLGGLNDKKKQGNKHITALRRLKQEYIQWKTKQKK